jgi:hypothetical protein
VNRQAVNVTIAQRARLENHIVSDIGDDAR